MSGERTSRRTGRPAQSSSARGSTSGDGRVVAGPPELSGAWTPDACLEVLRRVLERRAVCYLLVTDGKSEKCLYFPFGGLRLTSLGARRGVPLRWLMSKHPSCTPELARQLEKVTVGSGERASLEDSLSGPLREIAQVCSKRIVRDELLDLVVWDGAEYEFHASNPPPVIFEPEYEAVKLSLGVKDLLSEVRQAVPRWKKLRRALGSPSRTRVTLRSGSPSGHLERALLGSLREAGGEGRTLDELVLRGRRAGATALEVCERVAELSERGTLRVEPNAKPRPRSKELLRREADELEAAIELMINKLAAHRRIANLFRQAGDTARASEHLQQVGLELERRDDAEGAIEVYREIVAMNPQAFAAREHIALMLERLGRTADAVREWFALARQFASFGLFNRAKDRLRKAIRLDRRNPDLRRFLIDALQALGQRREAAQEYRRLAELYTAEGREDEALTCLQQVAELDSADVEAREALRRAASARGAGSKAKALLALAVSALVLAGGAFWIHGHYRMLQALARAREEALQAAQQERFAEARRALDDFQARFGVSDDRLAGTRDGIRALENLAARKRFARAQALEEKREVRAAMDAYRAVRRQAPDSKWARRAEERLAAIEKLARKAERAAQAVAALIEVGGREQEAAKQGFELMRTYSWTAAARATTVPLLVETEPPGASVEVEGEPQRGVTPCFAWLPGPDPLRITCRRDGYEPTSAVVDPAGIVPPRWPLRLQLQRKLRWRQTTEGPLVQAPGVADDGSIVLAGSDYRLYGLDPTGALRWSRLLGLFVETTGPPVLAGRTAVVVLDGREVVAFDVDTGRRRWRNRREGPELHAVGALSTSLLLVAARARVDAFDPVRGRLRWSRRLPGSLAGPLTVDPPRRRAVGATTGGLLVIVDEAGKVYGLKVPGRPVGRAVPGPTGCLVATDDGKLHLVWRTVRWSRVLGEAPGATPLWAGDRIYVPVEDTLLCLSAADGEPIWSRRFSAKLSTPAFREGRLYVSTRDGRVHALVAATGKTRWIHRAGGAVYAPPVPVDGAVLVASTDRSLSTIVDELR
ncbi:MAG: hypothetical protein D6731_00560 [Planctomycetota bacterium]|nr:MAG: hypothetical protein D6731_00560 [Planctomycetota bacterium]